MNESYQTDVKLTMYTSFEESPMDKIITLLRSSKSEFISGEKLSKSLGLSRTAIWKNIRKLQMLGYKIESKSHTGYKMHSITSHLLPWEITNGLQTDIIGRKVYYFDIIDSTQNFALKLSQRPHENGSVIIAEKQTMGRGRLDRKWISPKGGIWLSILLKPNFEISQTSLFPMATSLALAKAIEKVLRIKPELKWPNDLMIKGKKVAGILIDVALESNKIDYLVIGVGINFRIQPEKISRLIKNGKKYDVDSLVKKNQEANPVVLVQQFLYELEQVYNQVISNQINNIPKEWAKRSTTIGRKVSVETNTGIVTGKATGIAKNGALILSNKGKNVQVLSGDVVY